MRRQFLFFVLVSLLSLNIFSQDGVSIGRTVPDESAILHIHSPTNNKGVLFPSSSPSTVRDIINPANGLFLYDTIFHRYTIFKSNVWMYLNPWDTEQINPDNMGDENEDITYISTPYEVRVNNNVSADRFEGNGVVPIGGIIMWSGAVDKIPDNYRLCTAGQGTYTIGGQEYSVPNLTGRFIRAAATPNVTTGGGVNTSSTVDISYVETPRYIIQEPTCSEYQFIYTISFTADCDGAGPPSPFDTFVGSTPANSCNEAFFFLVETDWVDQGCITLPVTYDNCDSSPNPNYYRTRAACRNDDVVELEVAIGVENRPLYYDLAYIIRVE